MCDSQQVDMDVDRYEDHDELAHSNRKVVVDQDTKVVEFRFPINNVGQKDAVNNSLEKKHQHSEDERLDLFRRNDETECIFTEE